MASPQPGGACRVTIGGLPPIPSPLFTTVQSHPLAERAAKPLASYRPFWAKRFGNAPFLPTSRAEMDALGWDSCDIVIVTGDA